MLEPKDIKDGKISKIYYRILYRIDTYKVTTNPTLDLYNELIIESHNVFNSAGLLELEIIYREWDC